MPPPYRVIYSKAMVARIKEIHSLAKEMGIESEFLGALKEFDSRLTQDPTEFGDPAFTLHGLDIQIRHQIIKPLVVYWGVRKEKSLVFLKTIEIWPDRAP
jgi:hypothetical protein